VAKKKPVGSSWGGVKKSFLLSVFLAFGLCIHVYYYLCGVGWLVLVLLFRLLVLFLVSFVPSSLPPLLPS